MWTEENEETSLCKSSVHICTASCLNAQLLHLCHSKPWAGAGSIEELAGV